MGDPEAIRITSDKRSGSANREFCIAAIKDRKNTLRFTRLFAVKLTYGLSDNLHRSRPHIVVGGVERQLTVLDKGGKQRGRSAH
jgi:hypothetical protein